MRVQKLRIPKRGKALGLFFSCVFGLVAIALLINSFAAEPNLGFEVEDTGLSGDIVIVEDSEASSGKAIQFGTQASVAVSGADYYGIAEGGGLIHKSEAEIVSQLDGYASLGARWIRFDMSWADVQAGGREMFDWTEYDFIIQEIINRNIKPLVILDWTPNWAKADDCSDDWCPPASMVDFAVFARAATERYRAYGVRHWEVWNEPNISIFWKPNPDVAAYASMLIAVSGAIKDVDPGAVVLSGGLSPGTGATDGTSITPQDFLRGLYDNGAKDSFDAFNVHPYCYGSDFDCPGTYAASSFWSQISETPDSIRAIMIANGDSTKKIWATEFGVPTDGGGGSVSEAAQAQMVTDSYALWQTYDFAGPLFWYSFSDSCGASTDKECWFGLVGADGTEKPAAQAFRDSLNSQTNP